MRKRVRGQRIAFRYSPSAQSSSSNYFAGWSGGSCSGVGDCTLTVNQPIAIEATIKQVSSRIKVLFLPNCIGGIEVQMTGLSSHRNFKLYRNTVAPEAPTSANWINIHTFTGVDSGYYNYQDCAAANLNRAYYRVEVVS